MTSPAHEDVVAEVDELLPALRATPRPPRRATPSPGCGCRRPPAAWRSRACRCCGGTRRGRRRPTVHAGLGIGLEVAELRRAPAGIVSVIGTATGYAPPEASDRSRSGARAWRAARPSARRPLRPQPARRRSRRQWARQRHPSGSAPRSGPSFLSSRGNVRAPAYLSALGGLSARCRRGCLSRGDRRVVDEAGRADPRGDEHDARRRGSRRRPAGRCAGSTTTR